MSLSLPLARQTTALRTRWLALSLVLAAECIAGSFLISDTELLRSEDDPAVLTLLGRAVRACIAGIPVLLLILSRRLGAVERELRPPDNYAWQRWMVGHVLVLSALLMVVWSFPDQVAENVSPPWQWVIAWSGFAAGAVACLLFAAAPPLQWMRLLLKEWKVVLISAFSGYVIRRLSVETPEFWQTRAWDLTSEATLRLTHWVLNLVYPEIVHHPPDVLSTETFSIQIFGPCSGIEGMALMLVFGLFYLVLFRNSLQFPRALLVIPVGLAVIWVANVARISALFMIGNSVSSELATRSFHSYAGWIGFTLVALGMIALAHRWLLRPAVAARVSGTAKEHPAPPLLVPLLVLLGASLVAAALSSSSPMLYPLLVVPTALALWHYRSRYKPMLGVPTWESVLIGAIVFVVWILLHPIDGSGDTPVETGLAAMPAWLAVGWVAIRIAGSVIIVPIAEELAFRGYLIRKLVARDFASVSPRKFTWLSFVASSVAFGVLHDAWLAGSLAGAAFAFAQYRRGELRDAIAAHVTSNALIAFWVLVMGEWDLW